VKGTFRSLSGFNYRVWAGGALVSNVGTWMQRTAQDWLVLTELTHRNATSVGIVMALQFGPMLLLLPLTGFAADHLDRRKLLLVTQAVMGALALGLGLLTVTGFVQLWQVYLFAFLLGCVTAFDSPARQTFVAELVGEEDLSNAVALNSTSFNAGRMIGPAVAGVLIASVGTGWVFLINAASFAAVLGSLKMLRVHELHHKLKAHRARGFCRRLPLCLEAARPEGAAADAVFDRHVRAQFSDLYLHHVGHGVSCRCGSVRTPDIDDGARLGHGRTAGGTPGEAPFIAIAGERRPLRVRLYARRVHALLRAVWAHAGRHWRVHANLHDVDQ
jgi:MFS family permease